MAKRQSIGDNPLDSLLETKKVSPKAPQTKTTPRPPSSAANITAKGKQRVTIQIDAEAVECAKNAVYWTPGLTLAKLIENGMRDEVRKLEKKQGKAFSQRKGELCAGRPIK